MFKGNFSRDSRSSRGSGSRFGGGQRGFGSRRPASRRPIARIDVSRYINKAVVMKEEAPFVPVHQFVDFALDERIKKNIVVKGYVNPSPIQDQAIPSLLEGNDVVGIANTGTGKTAAFLIPLVNKIILDHDQRMLVIVPTRELATQIADELVGFSRGMPIYSALCVGGVNISAQIRELSRRPAFVIGTPGRLKDLVERGKLQLGTFETVVLDEADRMLDMGFVHDMRQIIARTPKERQTLFFSATFSSEVKTLVNEFLTNPIYISVKTQDTAASIEQDVVRVPQGTNKFDILCDMVKEPDFNKVLVFGRTKHGVERLAKQLAERGFKAESIHGNKTQPKRQRALDMFKRDHVQILVATDVAARGLDINCVSHVINYDVPGSHEDYIHRIGRTGRAGQKGKALTFID